MRKLLLILFILNFNLAKAQTELVDFESTPQYVTIDSLTGTWQIGDPQTFYFDTAYSETRALVTDTLNMYSADSISYAYFTFPTSNLSSTYSISFKHIYNTTPNWDGGYVEYYDCFNDLWVPIYGSSSLSCPAYAIYYNNNGPTTTLNNSQIGFSGTSNGWETTEIGFGCALLSQIEATRGGGNAQFRFSFHSTGNVAAAAGWMIDDIQWNDFGGQCSGIEEYENSLGLKSYPSITNGKISFETENELFSKISIYDFSGKMIENFSFSPSNFKTLELSNLSSGMYFYSVEDGKAVGKFMIEK